MGAQKIEVDYGMDIRSNACTKVSASFLSSKGVTERSFGGVATSNTVVSGYEEVLGEIPVKFACNQLFRGQKFSGGEVEYAANHFRKNAEQAVGLDTNITDVFTPEFRQWLGNFSRYSDDWCLTLPMSSLGEDITVRQTKSPQTIRPMIERIFAAGSAEVFEDGMESEFSRALTSAIKEHGNIAIKVIGDLILSEKVDPEVASEALRWIGDMEHPTTYAGRSELLQRSLFCKSSWVRDGASIGLACLGNPGAIPHLKEAIGREPYELLRRNMELTRQDLLERDR